MWGNNSVSSVFTMKNGVRQGAIISAIAYCFYVENLFKILKAKKAGCWINGMFLGLCGYSDDNYCLAPSISALRDMLKTISEYAVEHNLSFSTNPDPRKCKTKLMAFLKKPRPLPAVFLGEVALPWVDQCKHLGNTIENTINGCQEDMRLKRAKYISKNIEINQEFHFAAASTRLRVNSIWNTHFSGSPLWNLFSPGAERMIGSYNRSIKSMMRLPLETHRFLLEPLSGQKPAMVILMDRFLSFMEKIDKSDKVAIKMLKKEAMRDVRSTTGANMRGIMLLMGKTSYDDVTRDNMKDIEYYKVKEEDKWKICIAAEAYEVSNGESEIEMISQPEMAALLQYICVS